MIAYVIADSPEDRKKLLLSMILLCFVSITCVNSLKCCNYVTPGVIRYSYWGNVNIYFSMGPYTLWGIILSGVVIHPYL